MKKWFLWAVLCMAMCAGLTACGGSDDDAEVNIDRHLLMIEWRITGYRGAYRFYKNHSLVWSEKSSGGVSGALSYNTYFAMGRWSESGGVLTMKFDYVNITSDRDLYVLAEGGYPWTYEKNQYDYEQLTLKEATGRKVYFDSNGSIYDDTDESLHDGALYGKWAHSYIPNKDVTYMTIEKDGKVHFVNEYRDIDFYTQCSTKEGVVTFDKYYEGQENVKLWYYTDKYGLHLLTEDGMIGCSGWNRQPITQ